MLRQLPYNDLLGQRQKSQVQVGIQKSKGGGEKKVQRFKPRWASQAKESGRTHGLRRAGGWAEVKQRPPVRLPGVSADVKIFFKA